MQLAENLFGTNSQNQGTIYAFSNLGQIVTKLKEWIIAFQLEQSYTKEEILAYVLKYSRIWFQLIWNKSRC